MAAPRTFSRWPEKSANLQPGIAPALLSHYTSVVPVSLCTKACSERAGRSRYFCALAKAQNTELRVENLFYGGGAPALSDTTLIDSSRRSSGVESRRSSRVERAVPLLISGHDGFGQEFLERTAAVSLNLHGCRYSSRHDCNVGTWVTLQIGESSVGEKTRSVRAQVKSVHLPRSARELYHVGVELEAPSNVWGIPAPPEDWLRLLSGSSTSSETAAATGPGRAPRMMEIPLPPRASESAPQVVASAAAASQMAAPAEAPPSAGAEKAPPPPTVLQMPPPPATAQRPNRVVVTPDQLVAAVQGKLQQAAEMAVRTALGQHLVPTLAKAISTIEEARQKALQDILEATSQQRGTIVHSSRDEILARLEDRLDEVRNRWDSQMEGFRVRAEEVVQRIERQSASARNELAHARELAEKAARELEPQITAQLAQALARAAEEFDRVTAQSTDRQLVRLAEESQSVTREALYQLEANVAEARATVQTAAREAFDEFRRQAGVHSGLVVADTTQRVTSSLAALDAEHRSACDARRLSIETDVQRAGEQITEQFRQSLRAFFYSCLVAAVGAVEQHSKTTGDGLSFDPKKFTPPEP